MLWTLFLKVLLVLVLKVGWGNWKHENKSSNFSWIATNGIVIATEKKPASSLVDDSTLEKVATICSNIGMIYSGMGPDFRVLVSKARKAAQAYKRLYMEEPPVKILVQEVAGVMQEYTQSG